MFLKGAHMPAAGVLIPALAILILLSYPVIAPCEPRFEALWSENPVRPGKPFSLRVSARWEGETGRYAVRPPHMDLPEGLVAGPVSSRSFREGDENVVVFQLAMTAPETGEIPGFPLRLSVFQAGVEEPFEEEISTDPLRVDYPRLFGIPLLTIFLCAALGFLCIALSIWWFVKRKRRLDALAAAHREETDEAGVLSTLKEELNASRVRGDTRAFFEAALKIHEQISPEETEEIREIRDRAEEATYGDLRLSGEEMEAWYWRLKRLEAPTGPENKEYLSNRIERRTRKK